MHPKEPKGNAIRALSLNPLGEGYRAENAVCSDEIWFRIDANVAAGLLL
jgi:hypothetical protein